ncbi:MAG: hypothetical protein A2W33_07205 [Chloroflexi bacterium RBG_16_52_11]|nr:MAG: hypothetical protein A2W33_07205 [Chloroflexi bacterium RBG_16_52_11]
MWLDRPAEHVALWQAVCDGRVNYLDIRCKRKRGESQWIYNDQVGSREKKLSRSKVLECLGKHAPSDQHRGLRGRASLRTGTGTRKFHDGQSGYAAR